MSRFCKQSGKRRPLPRFLRHTKRDTSRALLSIALTNEPETLLKRLQSRAVDTQPTWLRTVAMLCLLLVAFAGTAQAVHVHGQWLPHQQIQADVAVQASQAPSEAACPLCMAMHSALPVVAAVPSTEILAEKAIRVAAVADHVPDEAWHFARFSRPPPAMGTI